MAFVVASTVMIVASFVSTIVRDDLVHGPEAMLNLSSLAACDDPLVALPVDGTLMSAKKRARLSNDYKVRFDDVSVDDDVGRLEIGSMIIRVHAMCSSFGNET